MKILDVPQAGKIGVRVSQGGRCGQVHRAYVIPSDPKTPIQMILRRNFARVGRSWPTLTQPQQDEWIALAKTELSARKGGTQGPLLGSQLYTGINCTNLLCGNEIVPWPPPKPDAFPAVATGFAITHTAGVVTLKLATVGEPTAANPWIVRASTPQSYGHNAVPRLRIIGLAPAPQNGVCDISALYIARFRRPEAREKIWVAISATCAGWEGLPWTFMQAVPEAAEPPTS